MSTFARVPFAALMAACACLVCASAAVAEPGPIKLVSQTASEQAQEAISPALSANGRYLAFQGTIGGQQGVFREDLASGSIVLVAAMGGSSAAPSISADGRYISFTTSVKLDPVNDTNFVGDVYVADTSTSPPTYELASALDGCDPAQAVPLASCGLTYSGPGGSVASGRVALSADGRRIVFVTTADSDLGGVQGDTPAGQVVMRDLQTRQTKLVSVERNAETGSMTTSPIQQGAVTLSKPELLGAAVSADGTTVAWLGANLPAQVPLLTDERQRISEIDAGKDTPYVEPLWRRVADGAQAPTRRIVGGGDPLAPGCPPGGGLADPACKGPFLSLTVGKPTFINAGVSGWLGPIHINGVPQLSADGRTVALLGNPVGSTNVYLVNMGDGLDRVHALRELTREVSVSASNPTIGFEDASHIALNGYVFDLSLSADGNRIVIATARQRFPVSPPNLIGSLPAEVGLVELYMIDLAGETLQRLTHGNGGPGEASLVPGGNSLALAQTGGGATAPSLDASGHLVAFASIASNLVPGDGNDASDAFVVEDGEASRVPAASIISPGPRLPRMKRPKGMTLSAVSLPSGAVRLQAIVPSAGTLRADVSVALDAGARPRPLALASGRARKRTGGPVRLRLSLPSRLRRLAHTREGLYAMARVSFHRRKGRALHGEIQVRFHAHRKHGGR